MVRRQYPTLSLVPLTVKALLAQFDLILAGCRYEGIVLVDQKWVVGAPSSDDTMDSKKLDKMTVAQIVARGSKMSGVKMALGPEILHFRAGDE